MGASEAGSLVGKEFSRLGGAGLRAFADAA